MGLEVEAAGRIATHSNGVLVAGGSLKGRVVEVIGILGVIASLSFVGMEIRQNTTAVRAATIQAVSDQAMELSLTIAADEDLAQLVARMTDELSLDGISIGEERRLRVLVAAGFRRMENLFLQVEAGILDDDALRRTSIGFYRNTFARALWGRSRENYDPGFAVFWDATLAPTIERG